MSQSNQQGSPSASPPLLRAPMRMSQWLRLPGRFRRSELDRVVQPARAGERGNDWYIEEDGKDEHGIQLYAVHARAHGEGAARLANESAEGAGERAEVDPLA